MPAERPARLKRLAELLDLRRRRQGRGAARRADRARRGAHRRLGDRDLAPPGRRGAAAGPSWWRPTRRRCRGRPSDEAALLALLGTLAAAYESELGNPELAIERNQKIIELAPKDPEAVGALERLYVATGRFADLLAVYDKKLELAKSKDEELAIRFKLAGLYEDEIKQPDKAVQLYLRDPQAGSQADRGAGGARSHLPAARTLEGAGRDDRSGDRSFHRHGGGRRAEVPARRRSSSSTSPTARARSLSYREALTLEPSHVGARTALQAYLSSADPELQQAAVQELEPIYEATNDLARLVEVQRIKLSHEKKTDKRVELLLRIGKLEGQLGNADQAWEAYTRAFSESPSSSPARESLENLANILDNWQPLVTLYEKALSAKGKEKLPSALERELLLVVAVAYDEKLGHNRARGGVLPPGAEHPARGRLRAGGAGAALHPHRALERSGRHAAEEGAAGHRRRRARRDPDPHRHRLGGDAGQRRAGDRRLERRAAGQPVERAGAARARSALSGARRVPRAGRQPAAPAGAGRGRRRRDGRRCSVGWARCAS